MSDSKTRRTEVGSVDERPSYDTIFCTLASLLSHRSTCARNSVGCVVATADGHRVLAIGYNGNWRGGPNRCDSADVGNCGCLHAEENALLKMDYNDPAEKVIYVTVAPCVACAKRIVNTRISSVVYLKEYRHRAGLDVLDQARVPYTKFSPEKLSDTIGNLEGDKT